MGWVTTKERLHRLVDELSEGEAADALRIIAARRPDTEVPDGAVAVVFDDEEARRFLDAFDNPASFEAGLRRLAQRPRVFGE